MFLNNAMRSVTFIFWIALSFSAWSQTTVDDETKLPIDIEANTLNAQDQHGLTVYSGQVIATQGSLTLTGDQLEIQHPNRQVQKITTTGQPATFKRFLSEQNAWIKGKADTIIYLTEVRKIELIGQAYLEQEGTHKIEGPKLIYDMRAQTLNAGQTESESGRIKMTITPNVEPTEDKN